MKFKDHTIGFGAMELCIDQDRPPIEEAKAMLTDLVENHGLTFIDTADAYSLGEEDFGYGEELVRHLMGRSDVRIATKGGFTRPGGAWKKRGDPEYIKSACEASLRRLGVDAIPLYQLHQPDPEIPFTDMLGAFIDLKNEGKVVEIGVSNVTLEQLQTAVHMTEIATVQNGLSLLWFDPEVHDPFLRFCEEHSIAYFAYAPFGGHKNRNAIAQPEELQEIATRAGMSIHEFSLAFLLRASPMIVPIPGSKNKQHILNNLAAANRDFPEAIYEELLRIFAE